jgi:hypothetical protein
MPDITIKNKALKINWVKRFGKLGPLSYIFVPHHIYKKY